MEGTCSGSFVVVIFWKLKSSESDGEIPLNMGMLQVLAFIVSRLRNEQAPVVDAVVAELSSDTLPVELWQPEDATHLEALRDNAVDANDDISSTGENLAELALRIVKRRLRVCSNPHDDTLLSMAMTALYRYGMHPSIINLSSRLAEQTDTH